MYGIKLHKITLGVKKKKSLFSCSREKSYIFNRKKTHYDILFERILKQKTELIRCKKIITEFF